MTLAAVTPIGAVVALVYVSAITSILWWMLHLPQVGGIEQHVNRVHRETGGFSRIVVPILGDFVSLHLVALAAQMAKFRGASMDVVYVVEVPLQLPLDAVSQSELDRAEQAFKQAQKIAARYDVHINRRVERARQAGPTIVQYAMQNNVDVLLMADIPKSNRRGSRYARTVEYVLENAPCEVIIRRPPMDS
jgi:nucleotide-binding universal stress UspA family protein